MRRALKSAAGLTNRLLSFSRRQALQPKRIEPDRFIAGIKEFLQRTLGPEIRLALMLGDGKSDVVCDAHELESVLLNLAINARDAMPNGGHLTISVFDRKLTAADLADQDQVNPGGYVEIKVADTGLGMTPDVLSRAFEPFFSTKPTGSGTGLGLSQVYGFVRQSGGFTRIESGPGEGTVVSFFLPSHPRQGAAAPSSSKSVESAPPSARGVVLVVEDQDAVRAQIVEVLTEMGCEIVEAVDGIQAMRIVNSRRDLDLLVTDVGLPGLNGRQLADAALEAIPSLPVLLITGYAGKALDDIRLADSMQILRKPFELEDLAAQVKALLTRQ